MRLIRENILIASGLFLALLPMVGIPNTIKVPLAAGIGFGVFLIALSVRRRIIMLKRKIASRSTMPNGH